MKEHLPNPARRVHALELGSKVRALRRAANRTLADVARSIGLSTSAISQIENGKTEPSLQTLRALSEALHVPLATFFETGTSDKDSVVRRGDRKALYFPRDHLRYELLTPDLINKGVEFLWVELDPAPPEKPPLFSHKGEEYGVVIQGRAEIRIDQATYILNAGDSVCFRGTSPHSVRNAGRAKAVMIWAISPPSY